MVKLAKGQSVVHRFSPSVCMRDFLRAPLVSSWLVADPVKRFENAYRIGRSTSPRSRAEDYPHQTEVVTPRTCCQHRDTPNCGHRRIIEAANLVIPSGNGRPEDAELMCQDNEVNRKDPQPLVTFAHSLMA